MKLVVKLKLVTDKDTDALLRETTEQYRRTCNHLSQLAFATKTFDCYDLHSLAYHEARALFELPSQLVIRAIAGVASAYKSLMTQVKEHNRSCPAEERRELTQIEFAPNLAIPYDQRLLSYNSEDHISLRLLKMRIAIGFQAGEKRKHLLHCPKGQADLKADGKGELLHGSEFTIHSAFPAARNHGAHVPLYDPRRGEKRSLTPS